MTEFDPTANPSNPPPPAPEPCDPNLKPENPLEEALEQEQKPKPAK